jgi:alpha-tubulin suppressor-like RCC1 family protein
MATQNYYTIKNAALITPATATDLGSVSQPYGNLYLQGNLNLGSTAITSTSSVVPKITSISYPNSALAADPAGGQTITVNGSGFLTGISAYIGNTIVGSVSVVNTSQITFTSPAQAAGSYTLSVMNTDGGNAGFIPGITYSALPVWSTAAGSLGSGSNSTTISTITLAATENSQSITYAVTSGSLPPGLSLASNGNITGTIGNPASTTTYNFTVTATDPQNQTASRNFSYTVNVTVIMGKLWAWGSTGAYFNGSAYVPIGDLGDNTRVSKSSPVQIYGGGTTWTQIAMGDGAGYGIKTDGTLWSWGDGSYGELGNNNSKDTTTPFLVSSPIQTVAGGTSWSKVSASRYNVGAIKTDGTLWVWGGNNYGQLGIGTSSGNKSSPVQLGSNTTWKYISIGFVNGGIKTDGTLWMWGDNGNGQIGDGSTTKKSSPVQTIAGGTNWSSVSTSGGGVSAAIKTDGTLWTWGFNYLGALGDSTTVDKSSPVQTIAGGNNWKQVSTAYLATAAIKTDGTLWVWGDNRQGALGTNNITSYSSPVQTVAGGTNWKQVTAQDATWAIKTDGTLWGWGYNPQGQIGDGTTVNKSSPVQNIAGGTSWLVLAGGSPSASRMFALAS